MDELFFFKPCQLLLGSGGDTVARFTQIPIREIVASDGAFSGIRTNGTVISWGDERYGGDSRAVESHLRVWDEL